MALVRLLLCMHPKQWPLNWGGIISNSDISDLNIKLNSIAPGVTKTEMSHQMDDKAVEKALSNIPLSRLAEPTEIAQVVLFLSSEMSSYISGQTIRVDGGLV